MNLGFEIQPPIMPNFITLKMPPVDRSEPLNFERGKIPISSLTQAQAEEYAELMKQTFLKHWENSKR